MIYCVTVRLAFHAEGFATGFFNHAKALVAHAHTINPGQVYQEISFARLEHCYHDEETATPCELIDEQETP